MEKTERPPSRMRLSSARLASLFVLIFAAGVTLVLAAVYFLTARVLDREVDAIINAEVTQPGRRLRARRPAAARLHAAASRGQLGPHRRRVSADRAQRLSRSPATWRVGRSTSELRRLDRIRDRRQRSRRRRRPSGARASPSSCPAGGACSSAPTSSSAAVSPRVCGPRCSGAAARACCSRHCSA